MAPAPSVYAQSKTEIAIADAMLEDGGARFRILQEKWIKKLKDAFNPNKESGRRSHYGFSGAGDKCERALWLRWHWMNRDEFAHVPPDATTKQRADAARMMRLVNRGHLEEARFMAMLELVGTHIDDPVDGQERVSMFGGHAGSALDALMYNSPDIPNEWHLGEFKTMNDRNFQELKRKKIQVKKPEHYVQIQLCMAVRGIHKCLYMVVNKNDDDLYVEVVHYDKAFADIEIAKIARVMFAPSAPPKISNDPSWFECKFCDCHALCQLGTYEPEPTCRSCVAGHPSRDSGAWLCGAAGGDPEIPKDVVKIGCPNRVRINI